MSMKRYIQLLSTPKLEHNLTRGKDQLTDLLEDLSDINWNKEIKQLRRIIKQYEEELIDRILLEEE